MLSEIPHPYCILELTSLLPLLETLELLKEWAQKSDVLVCNFVAAIIKVQGQILVVS